VGLGLLRWLIALLIRDARPGTKLYLFSYAGGLLAGCLCLGLAVAQALIRPVERPSPPALRRTGLLQKAFVVGLGTVAFGLSHAVLALLFGLMIDRAPLVIPLGFLFGLGLSLAVADQLQEGKPRLRGAWLWRTGLASGLSFLTQAIFLLARQKRAGISIAWDGNYYHSQLAATLERLWPALAGALPRWADYLGLVDAALVGAVMAIGIAIGLEQARRQLARWRDLSNRAGE
jgi:hypothetical protein